MGERDGSVGCDTGDPGWKKKELRGYSNQINKKNGGDPDRFTKSKKFQLKFIMKGHLRRDDEGETQGDHENVWRDTGK